LRYFKQVNVLRVAAANVMGPLPLMRVSDRLTDIAEVILERVTQLAFEQLKKNNAFSDVPENSADLPFGIIAYGKLAGFELGYASDLDIVFIYDDKNNHTIEVEFYLRLSQRILHLLNTRTHMGILYHVDTQLRPLGHSGLLVSSLSFFEEYQNDQAWSWEHQALVRARMVVGTPQLRLKFNLLRRKILQKARDPQQLAREVSEMRDKMRIQKGSNLAKSWDLKAGRGGIIDIEFLVQYFVLRFAAQYPVLLRYPDNMRILDFLEATKLIVPHQAEMLRNAYCTLRDELHALNLQQLPGVVGVERFADLRNSVVEIWAEWLGDNGYVL